MNKEKMFVAKDENGKEAVYEMLLVKNVDNVPVIWYTDGTYDKDNNKNIYISSYEKTSTTFVLNEITDNSKLEEYANIFKKEYKE